MFGHFTTSWMKRLKGSFLFPNQAKVIFAKEFNFWLTFLQSDFTWDSNISLFSTLIPRNFSHLLLEMAILLMLIWIYFDVFVRRWDFSGFAFRRFLMNDFTKGFRHPRGVLHSLAIKNIFYDKMNLRLFYFRVTIWSFFGAGSVVFCEVQNWNKSYWNMLNSASKYGALRNPEDDFGLQAIYAIKLHSLFPFSKV